MRIEYILDFNKTLIEQDFEIDVTVFDKNRYSENDIINIEDEARFNGAKIMANQIIEYGIDTDKLCWKIKPTSAASYVREVAEEIIMPSIQERALNELAELLISIIDSQETGK